MNHINDETFISTLTVKQFRELFFSCTREKPKEIEKNIIGIKECSKLSGFSISAIYQRTAKGLIPCFKRDGKILFKRQEIMEWLMENRVPNNELLSSQLDSKIKRKYKY